MIAAPTRSSGADRTSHAASVGVSPVDVLVVDDDGPTRAVVIEALEFAGYRAHGAADGAAALALAERLRPRLILLDLWMPVMDGWQFAAHYRNTGGPTAPIVLLSAEPQLPGVTEQIGAYGFIRKPFDFDFFREVVARAITADVGFGGGEIHARSLAPALVACPGPSA
jgi:CheY-like chemotaxis protein